MDSFMATGFVVVAGEREHVENLSVKKAGDYCLSTGGKYHITKITPSQNPDRLILGFQIGMGNFLDGVNLGSQYHTFIQGNLYGSLHQTNAEPMNILNSLGFATGEFSKKKNSFSPLHFDGDCALAFVDKNNGEITVYNDPIGYRRIFYIREKNLFAVGTRLPFLLRLLNRDWNLDTTSARIFLAGREPRWPNSLVSGVSILPPLHRLSEKKGKVLTAHYWQPLDPIKPVDEQIIINELYASIYKSVKRKVEGRRTFVALSGGYDSTCLAKIASQLDPTITALSMGYNAQRRTRDFHMFNETDHAERIAKRLGMAFERRVHTPDSVRKVMAELPQYLDQPGMDPATFFLLSKTAKEMGFEVMITGEGGDACFAAKNNLPNKVMNGLGLASKVPFGLFWAGKVAEIAKGRGPFCLFNAYLEGRPPETVFELQERATTAAFLPTYKILLGDDIGKEINQCSRERAKVIALAMDQAGCVHERRFLFSIWANPDEHHVDSAVSFTGISLSMPFMERNFLDHLLRYGAHRLLQTRQFEAKLFGGIPTELMLGRKSGFILPYSRWAAELYTMDLEEIIDTGAMWGVGLNKVRIQNCLKALQTKDTDESDPLDLTTARFIYRLIMLKNYTKSNQINCF